MLLSSLGNVLVSRIRMFNLELSRKTKREFLHISCVWDQRLTAKLQTHIPISYITLSCKLFTSTLSKVSLILICESILFRSSNFSFSYPCDHQRTVELGHRSCVQLFTSLDESGAACLCVFLCRAAAAMW